MGDMGAMGVVGGGSEVFFLCGVAFFGGKIIL